MPDTINRLDAMFVEFPTMRADDAPTEGEIIQAEQRIGVVFPDDYKQFVLRYGGAMVGPYPVFGLRPVEVMDGALWSMVDVTEHYRADGVPGASEWAVISMDHAGNPIGIGRDGAIWIHDHDFGGLALLASDFEDYLRTHCLRVPNGG